VQGVGKEATYVKESWFFHHLVAEVRKSGVRESVERGGVWGSAGGEQNASLLGGIRNVVAR